MRGSAAAPPKIREALHAAAGNSWTETLVDIAAADALKDAGDVDLSQTADVRGAIERAVDGLLVDGGHPIVLGGDHSITYPIIRALRRHQPRLTIVQIDAHNDLYEEFAGDRFSHACPFARIMESGVADRLIQVGIRAMTRHQREQADRYDVEVIDMRAWQRGVRPVVNEPVYLSIDLDGIDPAFAPGVSHPEPGGLSAREVIGLLQDIGGTVIGADVVEYNPTLDPNEQTARVAAKLVKEIAARIHGDASTEFQLLS
jgi:agmatinase